MPAITYSAADPTLSESAQARAWQDEYRRQMQANADARRPAATTPTTPLLPGDTGTTLGGVPGDTTGLPGSTGGLPGAGNAGLQNFDAQFNDIISGLLNPPAMFADVNRRAAEVGAGRGVAGSEAAFGTGLRMTDEERLRRQGLGAELVSSREQSQREYRVLDNRTRELDLQEERIRADIALGNRTAANAEELARIEREKAQIARDQLNLERTVQAALGRATDASGNPIPINTGSSLSTPWDWMSGSGGGS